MLQTGYDIFCSRCNKKKSYPELENVNANVDVSDKKVGRSKISMTASNL